MFILPSRPNRCSWDLDLVGSRGKNIRRWREVRCLFYFIVTHPRYTHRPNYTRHRITRTHKHTNTRHDNMHSYMLPKLYLIMSLFHFSLYTLISIPTLLQFHSFHMSIVSLISHFHTTIFHISWIHRDPEDKSIIGKFFGRKLALERRDVWDIRWSEDDEEMLCIMEKTKMVRFYFIFMIFSRLSNQLFLSIFLTSYSLQFAS